MESRAVTSPLIVILGQTSTGKSSLAIDIAERFGGEIIAADSRTVYKGMDISTAKPTSADLRRVRHHLIDVVEPAQGFTAAQFKLLAQAAMDDIASRGKLPVIVGGTGLYIDALIYDFNFRGEPAHRQRLSLVGLTTEELSQILECEGIAFPENSKNPRHLIRSIETRGQIATKGPLRQNTLILGLRAENDVLRKRLVKRVEAMTEMGLVEEARELAERYGWELPALQIPAFKALKPYIEGRISLDEAKRLVVQYDMQYAKRQRTWFKRNPNVHWISKKADSVDLITTFLNKVYARSHTSLIQ